jgi:Holliday junction resolvasome RuvABC endonuclease subunit
MIYVGIDYSINSPGICILQDNQEAKFFFFHNNPDKLYKDILVRPSNFYCYTYPKDYKHDTERFHLISEYVIKTIQKCRELSNEGIVVGLEDYSMGSRGKVFNLAENAGILKHKLFTNDIDFHLFAPKSIKKSATGNGNADKSMMYAKFLEEGNLDIHQLLQPKKKIDSSFAVDLADAYFIAKAVQQKVLDINLI